ncbi:MAG: LysR family transcriptional regulator [Pelomonas sp.]|nr:LysR family transcriptional regulator [Roseateles sp.]
MRLTLRQLEVLLAVADHGSTTAAAAAISLSQSATSAALLELERALEVRLFDRVGTRLLLNDVGRALLPQARAVFGGAQALEREFTGGARLAPIRVGASTTIGNYLLPSLVAGYLAAEPRAELEVRVANTADVVAAVGRLEVDVGFIEGPCHDPEVAAAPWREDELVVVAAPQHPALASGAKLGVNALRAARWLLREPGSGTREAVEQALLPHLKQLREGLRFGDTEAIKLACAEGLGLSCLSATTVRDWLASGRLVRVPTPLPRLVRPLYLVHQRRREPSPSVQRFVTHCRQNGAP